MATGLDLTLVPAAAALIERVGVAASIVQQSGATYDPAQGLQVGATEIAAPVKISPPGKNKRQIETADGDGTGQQREMAETFVAASGLSIVPAVNDRLVYGGVRWTITLVEPLTSGDQVAAYRMEVRR